MPQPARRPVIVKKRTKPFIRHEGDRYHRLQVRYPVARDRVPSA